MPSPNVNGMHKSVISNICDNKEVTMRVQVLG